MSLALSLSGMGVVCVKLVQYLPQTFTGAIGLYIYTIEDLVILAGVPACSGHECCSFFVGQLCQSILGLKELNEIKSHIASVWSALSFEEWWLLCSEVHRGEVGGRRALKIRHDLSRISSSLCCVVIVVVWSGVVWRE